MLSDHMLPEAALPLLQRAMAKGLSRAPMVQYLVGLNLMYAGRHEQAQEALEASLRGNPDLAPAHWALAKLADAPTRGARIDRLRAALVRIPPDAQDAPLLGYALFHELDRAGDTAAAWPLLEQAMRRRRAQVRHDSRRRTLFDAAWSCRASATSAAWRRAALRGRNAARTHGDRAAPCARTDAASAEAAQAAAAAPITGRAGRRTSMRSSWPSTPGRRAGWRALRAQPLARAGPRAHLDKGRRT